MRRARGDFFALMCFVRPCVPEEGEKLLAFFPTNILSHNLATMNVEFVDGSYLFSLRLILPNMSCMKIVASAAFWLYLFRLLFS